MLNMTWEFKLEPTAEQVSDIEHILDVCRNVWNFALRERKDSRNLPISELSNRALTVRGYADDRCTAIEAELTIRNEIPRSLSQIGIDILSQQPVPGMQGDSLGRPKDFVLQQVPARLSNLSPRRIPSTGSLDLPLPTATDNLSTRHITGLC